MSDAGEVVAVNSILPKDVNEGSVLLVRLLQISVNIQSRKILTLAQSSTSGPTRMSRSATSP
jgi:hypothetical protein